MSSSDKDSAFFGFVFGLIAIVAAIAAALWLGYWILFGILWAVPYALFTAIPCAAITLAVGYGLLGICTSEPVAVTDSKADNPYSTSFYGDVSDRAALSRWENDRKFAQVLRKLTPRKFYPRRLILALPVLTFLALITVQIPMEHTNVTEKVIVEPEKRVRVGEDENVWDENGKHPPIYKKKPAVTRDETKIVLQWPWLYNAFNQVNSSWQDLFSASYLKQGKPYEPVLFDRNYISVSVWLALLFFGPMLFWGASQERDDKEDRNRVYDVERAVEQERSLWQSREKTWQEQETKLHGYLDQWQKALDGKKKEVELLTAKLTFTPEGQQAKAREVAEKPGVLDSDLL